MHAAAQSMHEYVWCIKWDQEKRNGWLNLHPPDRESCLTSGLPTRWRACKLPHCVIDSDVAFWYDNSSPAWMHQGREGVLSLGDARQEASLDVGLLKKIVAGKKEFIGRSWENCYFQHRNSVVHILLRRWQLSNNTWNWFHMFSYERLFSICYGRGTLSTPPFLSEK